MVTSLLFIHSRVRARSMLRLQVRRQSGTRFVCPSERMKPTAYETVAAFSHLLEAFEPPHKPVWESLITINAVLRASSSSLRPRLLKYAEAATITGSNCVGRVRCVKQHTIGTKNSTVHVPDFQALRLLTLKTLWVKTLHVCRCQMHRFRVRPSFCSTLCGG